MDITSFPYGIETENSTIPRHHSGNDIALSGWANGRICTSILGCEGPQALLFKLHWQEWARGNVQTSRPML